MSLSNKIIDPSRVRVLMAQMQTKVEKPKPIFSDACKIANAYKMIEKTGCTITAASESWKVSIKSIIKHAKDNGFPLLWDKAGLTDQAKRIVSSKNLLGIRHGLRTRVAYELAIKHGVSKACRMVNVSREGLYAYCRRHELPTPLRAG